MFLSYLLCGFVPLFPYVFIGGATALPWSIAASLCALFILGIVSGKVLKTHMIKNAVRMAIIGGIAIFLGVVVGMLIK
jgi:predicted membrane protein (TIGR00267 family)